MGPPFPLADKHILVVDDIPANCQEMRGYLKDHCRRVTICTSPQRARLDTIFSAQVRPAAIPENLLESEVFGHERGAFTGATERRTGRFGEAGDGTLFLDEIGEMSFTVQSKLLRVLQGGRFNRVGGRATLRSRARVIAATHRDLPAAGYRSRGVSRCLNASRPELRRVALSRHAGPAEMELALPMQRVP